MSLPSVTVVICTYNYERWVAEAIDSALGQDYPGELLDVLVIDDGSTDGTPEVLERYGSRIRVVRQANAGLGAATERGIREARGELVALLDADDVWLPHKLRTQVAFLQQHPQVGLVYSDKEMIDAEGRRFAPSYFAQLGLTPVRGRPVAALLRANVVPAPTVVFRRSLAEHALPIPAEAPYQDWWLALRIAAVADIDFLPVPLVRYRVHGDNMAMQTDGPGWEANVRRSHGFRRWALRELDLPGLTIGELEAVWEGYLSSIAWFVQRAETTLDAEIVVTEADRAQARGHCADARAAEAQGDRTLAARSWLAARAANPFDAAARHGWTGLLAGMRGEPAEAAGDHAHMTAADRVRWAEQRYADGGTEAAIDALLAVVAETGDDALAAHAHADLAVIAFELGDVESARDAARSALRHDPAHAGALETIGRCAAARGDAFQAAFWLRRAAEATPDDASLWCALGAAEHTGARWPAAVSALERAEALAPLGAADEDRLRSARCWAAADASQRAEVVDRSKRRLLICVDLFYPSIGGLERLAEGTGAALQQRGWHVEIACRALPARTELKRLGMRIHHVAGNTAEAVERLVRKRRFDAVMAWSDPFAWPVPAVLSLPLGPRVVVVPCITPRGDRWVRKTTVLQQWRAMMSRADVVVHNSERAFDARLNRELGLDNAVYVPQAVAEVPPEGSIRAQLGLRDDLPVLLYIANLHPHKNHAGLLETLADHPGEFQLVLSGFVSEGAPHEAERVRALAASNPRAHMLEGLEPAQVAGAMREADLFVNPSHAEAVPLVVQEAMCAGTPWLATPECGAVHDWAGGVILPLEDFGSAIDRLLADPDRLRALGRAGRAHWEACFHYDVAAECYDALLRGGDRVPEYAAPGEAVALTDELRAACYEALIAPGRVHAGVA